MALQRPSLFLIEEIKEVIEIYSCFIHFYINSLQIYTQT